MLSKVVDSMFGNRAVVVCDPNIAATAQVRHCCEPHARAKYEQNARLEIVMLFVQSLIFLLVAGLHVAQIRRRQVPGP